MCKLDGMFFLVFLSCGSNDEDKGEKSELTVITDGMLM